MTTRQYMPSPKNYKEKFELSIEGQQFTIKYAYNPREDSWYLQLVKDGVAVLDYVKLTQGYHFGYNYVDFPLTQGYLTMYSPSGDTDAATLKNFGTADNTIASVYLVYEVDDE